MEAEFSSLDVMVIEKEILRKTYSDIAFLIDKPVELLRDFIAEHFRDKQVLTYQQVLDQQKKSRPVVKREKPATLKKIKKEQDEARGTAAAVAWQNQTKTNRDREWKRSYKTKKVDYSKLRTVKVDNKTFIYIKPGEDPEAAKKKFLANQVKYKFHSGFNKDLVA
jgi:hypothetical protein